ncbi:hypothetical protein HDE_01844 [Halotydeus destructor]|nr:hypothetical protein HDE_01844 [Halotydeus destructor]
MLVTPFLLLAWVTLDHVTQGQVFGVSQKCLDCICDASSGCDATKQCHTAQNGGYFCGAYQISWPYWADGGRLGDRGQPADFESCLNNKLCSEATIVGYMKKWAQDCNGDGVVNCIDYAAIHVTGGTNCRPDWLGRSSYWRKFSQSQCFAEARGARASGRDFVESPNQGRPRRPARPAQPTPQAPRPTAQPAPPLPRRPPPQPQPSQPRTQPQPSQPRAQPQPPPVRQPAGRGNGRVSWTFANSTTIVVAERDPLLPFPGAFEDGFEPSRMRPLAGEVPNGRPPPEVSRPAPRQPERRQPEISLPPVPRVPEAAPTVRPFQPEPAPAQPSRPRPRNSTFAASGRAPSGPVPGECMDCLCQASSGCDPSKQCAGDFCGPFLISWSYWSDGGSPGW